MHHLISLPSLSPSSTRIIMPLASSTNLNKFPTRTNNFNATQFNVIINKFINDATTAINKGNRTGTGSLQSAQRDDGKNTSERNRISNIDSQLQRTVADNDVTSTSAIASSEGDGHNTQSHARTHSDSHSTSSTARHSHSHSRSSGADEITNIPLYNAVTTLEKSLSDPSVKKYLCNQQSHKSVKSLANSTIVTLLQTLLSDEYQYEYTQLNSVLSCIELLCQNDSYSKAFASNGVVVQLIVIMKEYHKKRKLLLHSINILHSIHRAWENQHQNDENYNPANNPLVNRKLKGTTLYRRLFEIIGREEFHPYKSILTPTVDLLLTMIQLSQYQDKKSGLRKGEYTAPDIVMERLKYGLDPLMLLSHLLVFGTTTLQYHHRSKSKTLAVRPRTTPTQLLRLLIQVIQRLTWMPSLLPSLIQLGVVEWLLELLKEMRDYVTSVSNIITALLPCARDPAGVMSICQIITNTHTDIHDKLLRYVQPYVDGRPLLFRGVRDIIWYILLHLNGEQSDMEVYGNAIGYTAPNSDVLDPSIFGIDGTQFWVSVDEVDSARKQQLLQLTNELNKEDGDNSNTNMMSSTDDDSLEEGEDETGGDSDDDAADEASEQIGDFSVTYKISEADEQKSDALRRVVEGKEDELDDNESESDDGGSGTDDDSSTNNSGEDGKVSGRGRITSWRQFVPSPAIRAIQLQLRNQDNIAEQSATDDSSDAALQHHDIKNTDILSQKRGSATLLLSPKLMPTQPSAKLSSSIGSALSSHIGEEKRFQLSDFRPELLDRQNAHFNTLMNEYRKEIAAASVKSVRDLSHIPSHQLPAPNQTIHNNSLPEALNAVHANGYLQHLATYQHCYPHINGGNPDSHSHLQSEHLKQHEIPFTPRVVYDRSLLDAGHTNTFSYASDPSKSHSSSSPSIAPPALEFESRFESGNLCRAIQVAPTEYDLLLSTDINTNTHTQWFYFRVRNMVAGVRYKFNIVNLEKKTSAFNKGMRPVFYSEHLAQHTNIGWSRASLSDNIYYFPNHRLKQPRMTRKQTALNRMISPLKFNARSLTYGNSSNSNSNAPVRVDNTLRGAMRGEASLLLRNISAPNQRLPSYERSISNSDVDLSANAQPSSQTQSPSMTPLARRQSSGVRKHSDPEYHYTLTFTLQFPVDNDTCYLAHFYPYTYTYLRQQLDLIEQISSGNMIRQPLCYSRGGNLCEVITVTDMNNSKPQQIAERSVVVLSARIHPGKQNWNNRLVILSVLSAPLSPSAPSAGTYNHMHPILTYALYTTPPDDAGETNASWMLDGFLRWIASSNEASAIHLRNKHVFKIIPMLNIDGVIDGNYRCSLTGDDLNRYWHKATILQHPTIYYTKQLIDAVAYQQKLFFYSDWHGHSTMANFALYGSVEEESTLKPRQANEQQRHYDQTQLWMNIVAPCDKRLRSRLFPMLLQQRAPQFLKYEESTFFVTPAKAGSARVTVWQEHRLDNCFTLECSFFGGDYGVFNGIHYNTEHYQKFAVLFGMALGDFTSNDKSSLHTAYQSLKRLHSKGKNNKFLQKQSQSSDD